MGGGKRLLFGDIEVRTVVSVQYVCESAARAAQEVWKEGGLVKVRCSNNGYAIHSIRVSHVHVGKGTRPKKARMDDRRQSERTSASRPSSEKTVTQTIFGCFAEK